MEVEYWPNRAWRLAPWMADVSFDPVSSTHPEIGASNYILLKSTAPNNLPVGEHSIPDKAGKEGVTESQLQARGEQPVQTGCWGSYRSAPRVSR